uniref:Uncharacterized protein n=1 Tax=Cynoglossus semilaevis TaxID=244447 RepID=A0A3P8VIX3_CYNSE
RPVSHRSLFPVLPPLIRMWEMESECLMSHVDSPRSSRVNSASQTSDQEAENKQFNSFSVDFAFVVSPSDDFESKFHFHPVEDLPPPEEYRHFNKVYPSQSNKCRG